VVWPQILGRDLQDFPSQSSRFLIENCGQTIICAQKTMKNLDKTEGAWLNEK
jgi:hypothetical protein